MKYLIMAYDGTDEHAAARRANARDAHMILAEEMRRKKELLYAAVLLDDDENAIGSMRIIDMPSKARLEEWLDTEPYLTEKVWETIEIQKCSIPSLFE